MAAINAWLGKGFKRGVASAFSGLLSIAPALQAQEVPAEQAAEHWMHYYYADPQPQQFVAQVQHLAQAGALSDEARRLPMQVFLATLIAQHSTELEGWMEALSNLPEEDQQNLQLALWRADTPAAKAWLVEHQFPDYEVGPPKLRGQPIRTQLQVDMLWHRFYATGDWDLLRQLVSVLEQHRSNDLTPQLGEQAMSSEQAQALYRQLYALVLWSLEAHAADHPQVLEALGRMYSQGEFSLRQQQAVEPILESLAPGRYVRVDDIAAQ